MMRATTCAIGVLLLCAVAIPVHATTFSWGEVGLIASGGIPELKGKNSSRAFKVVTCSLAVDTISTRVLSTL